MSTLYVNTITPQSGDRVGLDAHVVVSGSTTLGDAAADVTTVTGHLTASNGMVVISGASTHITANDGVTTVSSKLTASNGASITGDATIAGDLTVDTNTLFVDSSTNKIGVGTTDPHEVLHVAGNLKVDGYIVGGSPAEFSGALSTTGSDGTGLTITGSASGPMETRVSGTMEVTGTLLVTGSSTFTVDGPTYLYGNATLGNNATHVTTVTGHLTASNGAVITNHITANDGVTTVSSDLTASNGLLIPDDTTIKFGTGGDASIEYDENGTDELRFAGAAATFEQAVSFDAAVTLGNAATDVTTVTGKLTASNGMNMTGDAAITGSLNVAGISQLQGSVEVVGAAIIRGNATLGDAATDITTVTSNLTASNGATITGYITANDGVATVSSDLTASNGLLIPDDTTIKFGTGGDATIEYDENGTDELRFAGAAVTFEQDVTFDNDVTLGVAATDVITVTGNLTASNGATITGYITANDGTTTISSDSTVITGKLQTDEVTASVGINIPDDKKLYFGTGFDATIEYDENGTDELRFAGAAVTFEQDVTFDNDVTLGVAASDVTTVTGKLTASNGLTVTGDITVGGISLSNNDNGTSNTVFGKSAGSSLSSGGNYNLILGEYAGGYLTTGDNNGLMGYNAGGALTTGSNNVAIGYSALALEQGGSGSVAIGSYALYSQIASGSGPHANANTAIGYLAGYNLTTGSQNVAVGSNAMYMSSRQHGCTAIGAYSLYNMKNEGWDFDDYGGMRPSAGNTAVGEYAGYETSTGLDNTFVGASAGKGTSETTGHYNTFVGSNAGANVNGYAHTNILIGAYAAADFNGDQNELTTGDYNILIGNKSDFNASDAQYQIVIGNGIVGTGDNDFSFGKASNIVTNDFDADAAWSRSSDVRKKRNIQDDGLGLEFINKLRTVTHQWKPSNELPEKWDEYNEENHMNLDITIHGMIAQEVKQALDEVGCETFGGWKERQDGMQTLSREMFVTPLIKAVQELSTTVKEQQSQIEDLKNLVNKLTSE